MIDLYYGAASGQQRSALRRLDPEGVMISHATQNNEPWDGDYDLFIDCGGFHHMVNGTGEYSDSHDDYLEYIERVEPDLFALRDYPCEPELLTELGRSVEDHQWRTTSAHADLILELEDYDIDAEPVAVVQGWTLDDYERHLDSLRENGILDHVDTVAIGSVCRRGYDTEIATIVTRMRDLLPDDYDLHAFGVKGSVLRFEEVVEALDSVDSAAYDWAESRVPVERDTASFTWRDSARAYLNWRHQLKAQIGTERLHGGSAQASFDEVRA